MKKPSSGRKVSLQGNDERRTRNKTPSVTDKPCHLPQRWRQKRMKYNSTNKAPSGRGLLQSNWGRARNKKLLPSRTSRATSLKDGGKRG